ncbi:oligosaccharide flippase family protein, partial [Candidatus Pelagibacter ubique]|nr:oligosaccharide flippase family protein [Candidatus Pelagibacter ubique]
MKSGLENKLIFKKKLIYGFKWIGIGNLIKTVISVILPFYLAIYIAPSELGKLAIVMIIYNFINMAFRPAFGEARIQIGDGYDIKKVDDVIFTINLLKMILITFFLYSLIPYINNFYNENFNNLFYILILINFISSLKSPRIYILSKNLDFKRNILMEVIPSLIGSIAGLIFAYFTKDVASILYATVISSILRVFFSQYFAIYYYKISFQFHLLKYIFSFGLWVMIERLIISIGQNIDKIILSLTLDLYWVGIYQIGKSLGYRLFNLLNEILNGIFFPLLSKMKNSKNISIKKINKIVLMVFLSGILLSLIALFIIPYITNFLGEQWIKSKEISLYLVSGGLLMFISNFILRSVFKAFGNAKIVATTELYKTITLCFLITTLGHFYQLSGIIFALILS